MLKLKVNKLLESMTHIKFMNRTLQILYLMQVKLLGLPAPAPSSKGEYLSYRTRRSPCEWRGGARHCSRAMVGESVLETC